MKVIDAYSRARALKNGELMDVTREAKEVGIDYPMAITSAVWRWISREADPGKEIAAMRFFILMNIAASNVRGLSLSSNDNERRFEVAWELPDGVLEVARFKVVCGSGDNSEMVVTILLDTDVMEALH